jgi:hypothetical protein
MPHDGSPLAASVQMDAISFASGGAAVLAATGDGMITRWHLPRPWEGIPVAIEVGVNLITG